VYHIEGNLKVTNFEGKERVNSEDKLRVTLFMGMRVK
jgi:hypothetical protein